MIKKIVIGNTERGILYKDKQFVRILKPGVHRVASLVARYTLDLFDISKSTELKGSAAKYLIKERAAELERDFLRVSNGAREVALVYSGAQILAIVRPGEDRLFWRGLSELSVTRFDISRNYALDNETIRDLSSLPDAAEVLTVKVPEQCKGVLLESGVIVRELAPGLYSFWRAQRDLAVNVLDTRLTAVEVSGQEMLTKDKVSLRINLAVSYRLLDVVNALRALSDIGGEIYRTAQLALRQAVGEKTLDELLESKEALNRALAVELAETMGRYGIEVSRVGVKDIILPGDMRVLFNQVVEAEKAAQAQNIRRREEVAATRSLLNTSKMMESNPLLLRLKELEALERISEKVENLTVYDGLSGVMKGLVSLKA